MSPEVKQALLDNGGSGDKMVPIDTENWETITDAMTGTVAPGGTAASAHLDGIDFAGKTGSAQTVSHEGRAKGLGVHMKDNAWFVGLTPRRNPEIAVVILWEGGMKGFYSARRAALVVEAYVNKQRMLANNIHIVAPVVPLATPPADAAKPTTEITKNVPDVMQHSPEAGQAECTGHRAGAQAETRSGGRGRDAFRHGQAADGRRVERILFE